MCNFSHNDVIKVAKELIDFGVHYEDYGDNYPFEGFECQCCNGEVTSTEESFKHELNCPILVAQDLLTGN